MGGSHQSVEASDLTSHCRDVAADAESKLSAGQLVHVGELGRWVCCVLLAAVLPISGCLSRGTTRKTSSMKSAKNIKASATELSSRNQSLLGIYSAEIEKAADTIISESPSITTRREALIWKAEAIPAIQASLLNPDPVAAILDTWVFVFQMGGYLERPVTKEGFGEYHPIMSQTLKNMDAEMEQLIRVAAPAANMADLRQRAETWATKHPIGAGLAARQSVDPELIRMVGESDLGVGALLQTVQERLGDLSARLDAYNMYLPKQARWQAELLLLDTVRTPQFGAATTNFATLSDAMAKTSNGIDHLPGLMQQTRQAVRTDIEGQRIAAQAFLHEERLQTLDALHQERIETVGALRNERLAATEDLRGEREEVFEALQNQEQAAIRDINAISEKAIQDVNSRSRNVIDHFFLRALELVLLTLLLCSLFIWFVLRWFVGRRSARPEIRRAA
jgi:hypothetical protein